MIDKDQLLVVFAVLLLRYLLRRFRHLGRSRRTRRVNFRCGLFRCGLRLLLFDDRAAADLELALCLLGYPLELLDEGLAPPRAAGTISFWRDKVEMRTRLT